MKNTNQISYPNLNHLQRNTKLGYMLLSHLGGLHSKMSIVSLYFYNHIIIEDINKELSDIFYQLLLVEMKHLQLLAKVCFKLGVDPRLWNCQNDSLEYWSPSYNVYSTQMTSMIENAIRQEKNTIKTYQEQIQYIDEPIIQDILNQFIIEDKQHIHILQSYAKKTINIDK